MVRFLILILMLVQTMPAFKYNEILLDAQCRIYPKLLMLKENGAINGNKREITFTIVYSKEDKEVAKRTIEKIVHYFDHKIGNVKFNIDMVSYDKLDGNISSDALYLLRADSKTVKKAISFAQKRAIPVFVYDFHNLQDGALFALNIEKTTVIYLNKKALYKTNLSFSPALYSIVRFVDAG